LADKNQACRLGRYPRDRNSQDGRDAIAPGGQLLIVEALYPPRHSSIARERGVAAHDVKMLVMTGGRQRSENEVCTLYQAAGVQLSWIVHTQARFAVIEGIPI